MQPLIIAGMHRSGTSMLTSILGELGLFIGQKRDENDEATFFLNLNNWLLRQAGAAWDYPEPFEAFLSDADLVAARAAQLRHMLTMPRAVEYLGITRYLKTGDIARLDVPWGWKDPRNTFTLPVWRKVFPGARLLVIHRHGADVASSLAVRAQRVKKQLVANPVHMSRWNWRLPVSNNSFNRCLDLEESLKLWESYTATANRHALELGPNALVLKYEEFLARPAEEIARIVRFAGLAAEPEAIARAVGRLRRDRAYGYRDNPAASALAERHGPALAAYGY